jgi:paraquat-inducible protein A
MHAQSRLSILPQGAVLPLSLAAIVLLAITLTMPIVGIVVGGKAHLLTMYGALAALVDGNSLALALLVAFTVCIAPALEFALRGMISVSGARRPGHSRGMLPALLDLVHPWSMMAVFALAVVVATDKIGEQAAVAPGIGLASLLLLLVCAWGFAWTRPRWARATSRRPLPDSRLLGWAYVLSAALLFIPALLLPVAVTHSPHGDEATTILGGVRLLWNLGSHALALILFVASIIVPAAKLATLALVLRLRPGTGSAVSSRLSLAWHAVHRVGPWSMLDILTLGILVTLLRAPPLIATRATVGAVAFASVVVLTLVGTEIIVPPRGSQP